MTAQNTPPKEQNKDEELRDAILMQFGAHLESGKWSLPPTEVAGNILALFQAYTKTIEREARIKALTDVDNLNLLNDSDEWHDYYISQVRQHQEDNKDE